MSREKSFKSTRSSEIRRRLGDLARKFSTQTVFLHEAIAQSTGLKATDIRCLSLIRFHPEDLVTAGWLSDTVGLTTGAITHVLDRLEKRGFIERVRDVEDRRKVFIRIRPESLAELESRYETLGASYRSVIERYKDSEVILITDYLQKMSDMTERLMAETIAARSSE